MRCVGMRVFLSLTPYGYWVCRKGQAQRILKSLIEEGSAVKIGAARATRYAEAMKRTEPHE